MSTTFKAIFDFRFFPNFGAVTPHRIHVATSRARGVAARRKLQIPTLYVALVVSAALSRVRVVWCDFSW